MPLFPKDIKTSPVRLERTTFGFGGQEHQDVSDDKTKACDSKENCFATCSAILLQKDPDLTSVIKAWPELPEHVKKTICTLVSVTCKEKSQ